MASSGNITVPVNTARAGGTPVIAGALQFDDNWLRLALVVHEAATSAMKPVLDDAIKAAHPTLVNKNFDDRLKEALTTDERIIKRNLLKYELPSVFPKPGTVGTYFDFDVGIVAKLIKFFVGNVVWQQDTAIVPKNIENLQASTLINPTPFTLVHLLREYRNWICHHNGTPQLSAIEFENHWENLIFILRNLGYDITTIACYKAGPIDYASNVVLETVKKVLNVAMNQLRQDLVTKKDFDIFRNETTIRLAFMDIVLSKLTAKEAIKDDLDDMRQSSAKEIRLSTIEEQLASIQARIDAINQAESSKDSLEIKKHRAQEACMAVHDEMLSHRELDLFSDPCKTKRKVDVMVQLVTLTCSEADAARLDAFNEREHILRRSFVCSKTVEVQDMFDDVRTVLARGLPGCGKSTFCHYILREWSAGRLWKGKFEFVFYINAPLVVNVLEDGMFRVAQVLEAVYPSIFREISYKELSGYPHLIIMDSIDECDVEKICIKSASFEEAIRQLIISPDTFKRIILGRPHACDQVRRTLLTDGAFEFIEVVGFSSDQLENYVQKFCDPPIGNEVVKKMRENVSLYNMAHIPVFANILCNVFVGDSAISIESVTEIYVYAYAVFLTRHLKIKPEYNIDASTFESLFNNEELITALANVSRMAFENVTSRKIFFEATDFHFSDIELTLVSAFIAKRKRFICFSHLTFMEFFAAIHMFINRVSLNEFVSNQHFRGVLPMLFGLLGGAVKSSTSPKIIFSFVIPMMKKFQIKPLMKHPLRGTIGKIVYGMDNDGTDLYRNLMFEFRNSSQLRDRGVYWQNNAQVRVHFHHQFEGLFYFMNNFLTCEGREVEWLAIAPIDHKVSLHELQVLTNSLSVVGEMVGELLLWNFSVDDEMIVLFARVCCFVRRVLLRFIEASDGGWMIFLGHLKEAKQKNKLRVERLCISGFRVDQTIEEQLRRIVREVRID